MVAVLRCGPASSGHANVSSYVNEASSATSSQDWPFVSVTSTVPLTTVVGAPKVTAAVPVKTGPVVNVAVAVFVRLVPSGSALEYVQLRVPPAASVRGNVPAPQFTVA